MSAICTIEFENNPTKVVYSGQLLRGNVHIILNKMISVKNISLRISGDAYSRWTDGFSDDETTYTGSENYLNERIYLMRGQEGINYCYFWLISIKYME